MIRRRRDRAMRALGQILLVVAITAALGEVRVPDLDSGSRASR